MSKQDKPVEVVVDRGRVWIKRGVQSFMLDYEGEIDDELNWYAQRLREALSLPAPPAPELPALPDAEGWVWYDDTPYEPGWRSGQEAYTAGQMEDYARAAIAADRAARVPVLTDERDEVLDGVKGALEALTCPESHKQPHIYSAVAQTLLRAAISAATQGSKP